MTAREFVRYVTASENDASPRELRGHDALCGVLAMLRSAIQQEIATNEGIAASVGVWMAQHGDPTPEKVQAWVNLAEFDDVMTVDIPLEVWFEVMEAD